MERNFRSRFIQHLNSFIVRVPLPALTLLSLHSLELDKEFAALASVAWIVFIAGALCFFFLGRRFGWDRKTIGTLTLACALGNTSFLGYPLLQVFYGAEALPFA